MNKKLILSILLILSLILISVGGIIGYSMMLKGITIRYASLESYDGTQLSILIAEPDETNNRFGDKKYGIVVAHGMISKAEGNIQMIASLARAGFTVVALDERGHGDSGGTIENLNLGKREYRDVIECARFLKKDLGCKKVCLVGHSMGALAVSMASVYADKKDILEISGVVAMSIAFNDEDSNDQSEELSILQEFFKKTFYIEFKIQDFSDDINISGAPYNYLVVVSENDALIPVDKSKDLVNLAGGVGKTSKTDFAIGNASDLFVIEKEKNAPDHGATPDDSRVIDKVIRWCELSMGLDRYEFYQDAYNSYMEIQDTAFYIGLLGFQIILIPLYSAVKNKILIYNKKESKKKVDEKTDKIDNKKILKFIGFSAIAIFISPLITMIFHIPVLQDYLVINVLVRDLVIATTLIFIYILLMKFENLNEIFQQEKMKRFFVSAAGASVMLFVFLLGFHLYDTYYDRNNKWQPFTFNPFIMSRFIVFITLLIEFIFIMGVVEYICRKQVQDNLFNAKNEFKLTTLIKTTLFNGLIKAGFLTLLIIGLFLAYDIENLPLLFNPSIISIFTVFIGLIILFIFVDFLLTIFYQHSKDYWFVIIGCYTIPAWYIASYLIRL